MGIILDGKGSGSQAEVNSKNRLSVQAIATQDRDEALINGNAYNVNTGIVTLSAAADSAVLYLSNNETMDLHITAIVIGLGPTTGGATTTESVQVTVIKNPTTGTIVDDATAGDINSNRNFGSAKTLDVTFYKGAEGKTFTDGSDHLIIYADAGTRTRVDIVEIIPKNKSIGVKIDAQTSNTNMLVYVALICHLDEDL